MKKEIKQNKKSKHVAVISRIFATYWTNQFSDLFRYIAMSLTHFIMFSLVILFIKILAWLNTPAVILED